MNIKYEKGWVESSQDTELKDRTKLAGGSMAGLESAMLGLYLQVTYFTWRSSFNAVLPPSGHIVFEYSILKKQKVL